MLSEVQAYIRKMQMEDRAGDAVAMAHEPCPVCGEMGRIVVFEPGEVSYVAYAVCRHNHREEF